MSYDVLSVCSQIITHSNQKGCGVSNLRLQKLLYFCQAYFLCQSPKAPPCFYEAIEAWDFGPVVPEVYSTYAIYGAYPIPSPIYTHSMIHPADQSKIHAVVDFFAKYSNTTLTTLIHNQKPWRQSFANKQNRVITPAALRAYFAEPPKESKKIIMDER